LQLPALPDPEPSNLGITMAILDILPYLDVSVRVAEQQLPEYDDPDGLDGSVSPYVSKKYIESKADSVFAVRVRFGRKATEARGSDAPSTCFEVSVYIDGKWRHGVIVWPPSCPTSCHIKGALSATDLPGMIEEQLFKFKSVRTGMELDQFPRCLGTALQPQV
jgi:hypothetical protein